MPLPDDLRFDAASFSGVARLFPLPNLVMFPHVLQPLHVFEPRYRALLEDALDDDRLIAMAVLAPGWEADYEGCPDVFPVACLGRVATHQRLDEGRYNVLLAGLVRVLIVEELPRKKQFREVKVEVYQDYYPPSAAARRARVHKELFDCFRGLVPPAPAAHAQLDQLLRAELSLGMLTDIVAYTLKLDVAYKESLLRERNVDRRAALLLRRLSGAAGRATLRDASGKFPPDFSAN
jgi:uncharacterized protein